MKIRSAKTVQTTKWVSVKITWNRKTFDVSVETLDGKLKTAETSGVATSYLTYFNKCSVKDRLKHFAQIKKYVERHIK